MPHVSIPLNSKNRLLLRPPPITDYLDRPLDRLLAKSATPNGDARLSLLGNVCEIQLSPCGSVKMSRKGGKAGENSRREVVRDCEDLSGYAIQTYPVGGRYGFMFPLDRE